MLDFDQRHRQLAGLSGGRVPSTYGRAVVKTKMAIWGLVALGVMLGIAPQSEAARRARGPTPVTVVELLEAGAWGPVVVPATDPRGRDDTNFAKYAGTSLTIVEGTVVQQAVTARTVRAGVVLREGSSTIRQLVDRAKAKIQQVDAARTLAKIPISGTQVGAVFAIGLSPASASFLTPAVIKLVVPQEDLAAAGLAEEDIQSLRVAALDRQAKQWVLLPLPDAGADVVGSSSSGTFSGPSKKFSHYTLVKPDPDTGQNLFAIHEPTSAQFDGDCIRCHSDKINGKSADPNGRIFTYHGMHIPVIIDAKKVRPEDVTNNDCLAGECHGSTGGRSDLIDRSAGSLRKNVWPLVCVGCHQDSGPGVELFE